MENSDYLLNSPSTKFEGLHKWMQSCDLLIQLLSPLLIKYWNTPQLLPSIKYDELTRGTKSQNRLIGFIFLFCNILYMIMLLVKIFDFKLYKLCFKRIANSFLTGMMNFDLSVKGLHAAGKMSSLIESISRVKRVTWD